MAVRLLGASEILLPHFRQAFKPKVLAGVAVADVSHKFSHEVEVAREEAALDFAAQDIAKQTPEVVVARETEEAARVRQHTDEPAEQSHVGQGFYLARHPVELIVEPPAAAKL